MSKYSKSIPAIITDLDGVLIKGKKNIDHAILGIYYFY